MNYLECHVTVKPVNTDVCDVLASLLGELGFDSFSQTDDGLLAWGTQDALDIPRIEELLSAPLFGAECTYSIKPVPSENWNETWEKNYFQPIVIGQDCVIHSSFHTDVPQARYDIVIDPKMAFGTGHHETTSMMLEAMLSIDLQDKHFLDMGCGTAVLGILASMKSAKRILAIDIDEWATENAIENCRLNHAAQIEVLTGGAETIPVHESFDYIFANINRNILLEDMPAYAAVLDAKGTLYMSGFYLEDLVVLDEKAKDLGLKRIKTFQKNKWAAAAYCF